MKKALLSAAIAVPVLGVVIFFTARPQNEPLPVFWNTPEFTLLDQDSTSFSSTEMAGKVWLASFVYTNCPDVCPLVTQRMAALRDSIAGSSKLRDQVRLLSITVDPLRDTPSVLRQYAQNFRASKPSWLFLTGPINQVIPLINEEFHLSTIHPQVHDAHEHTHAHDSIASDYMVSHSDRIVLIDSQRRVRGTYVSSDQQAFRQLWIDLRKLINE
ncbi:MAG: SCO family protein [Gemmatimonadota bacterium]